MQDYDGFGAVLVLYGVPILAVILLAAGLFGGLALALAGGWARALGLLLVIATSFGAYSLYRWTQTDPPEGAGLYDPHHMVRWSYRQWELRQKATALLRGPKPWETDAATTKQDETR